MSKKPAIKAAIVTQYGSVNQGVVTGLNSITLPTYTSTVINVEEFRKENVKFAGAKELGEISYSGFSKKGSDENGQDYLTEAWDDQRIITDERFYLDLENFMTCDLARDPESGFQVVECSIGELQKNNLVPYSGKQIPLGRIAYFFKHFIDGDVPAMAFVQGSVSEDTITGVPADTNIKAGDTIIIEGSTSNDGQYLVKEVSGTTVTLTTTGALTSEDSIAKCTIHGGKI